QNVNGFTASGLVNGETESVLTGITGATASGKNAGEYVTTLSGTDGNYNLTFVDGKLVIEKAKDNLSNVLTPIANTTVTTPKVNVVILPQVPFIQTPTFLNNGTPVNLVSAPIQNQPITMVSMGELRLNQDSNILSASNDIRVPVGDNSKIELVNGGVNLPNGVEQQFFVVGNEEN
ncbi:MBG domain-containing protein, partial [Arcobacter aquimarinus]